jgi:membrane protease YdiL (CAAX protease family)
VRDARRSPPAAPRLVRGRPAASRALGAFGAGRVLSQEDLTRPRWGLGDAVGGVVAGLVLSSALASIWLAAHSGAKDVSLGGEGLAQLGLWTGLLGAVFWASRRKGAGTLAEDFGFAIRPIDVPMGVAAGVLAQVALVPGIALLLRPLLGRPDVSGPTKDLVNSAYGVGIPFLILFVVVGAPVVEELFFRGLVMRSLDRRFGPVGAVIVSSALFGLAHPQSLAAGGVALVMISLAAFGAVLAVLALRTGRLGASIIAHATFNAWTIFFLLR